MNRMMMLSGAAVLALIAGGTASAQTKILNCYNAKGETIACRTNYGPSAPTPVAGTISHAKTPVKLGNGNPSKGSAEESVVVVGVGPEPASILPSATAPTRSARPGLGGDWVPVVAVDRLDKLNQWQAEFLGEKAPVVEAVETAPGQ
jgi:hypothetical protein